MNKTKIPRATHSWNPVTGCEKVSSGCQNCYAWTWAQRFKGGKFPVEFHSDKLKEPHKIKNPARIFVNSMSDLFHEDVKRYQIGLILQTVQDCPHHTFMVLTKRPERFQEVFCNVLPPANLWLGVTAENQEMADKRIPLLLRIPAKVRFVSVEPLLGPITFHKLMTGTNKAEWIIVGPETGRNHRFCDDKWIEGIWNECQFNHIPFFDKRDNFQAREYPETYTLEKTI